MNLLITGALQCTEEQLNEIRNSGHDVCFLQYEKDDLPCDYCWVEGVICNGLFIYHPIGLFQNLKFIQLTSAGFDRVPMDYIKEHNIEIHNAKGVYSIPMAEFAVCGVLQLYKQSRFFYENQKQHKWQKHRGLLELYGKTVLIIGCGDVGIECAKRFSSFGCHIIGLNRSKFQSEYFDKISSLDKLDESIPISDIIILSIAHTEETRHLMSADRIKRIKNTAILVNISRGAIIDSKALEANIESIGGAVLDVFEEEPLKEDSPLWGKKNVIITPHNSFVSSANSIRFYNHYINSIFLDIRTN